MPEFCGNCKFILADLQPDRPGICRRHPPTIFLQMNPPALIGKAPNIQMITESPRVPLQGWCGDWRAKPQGKGRRP